MKSKSEIVWRGQKTYVMKNTDMFGNYEYVMMSKKTNWLLDRMPGTTYKLNFTEWEAAIC